MKVSTITTVYFIRHAEPERSADSIYTDRTYPLTAKGLKDRKLVNAFLKDKSIDVVLSSPFKRAVDTVAEYASEIGYEVELIEDFRERAITNKWLGTAAFKEFAMKQWADFTYKLSDGESIAEVQARNLAALQDVLQRYRGKNIVIGTHGMALSSLLLHYDSGFSQDQHIGMPMPWVCKMVFDKPTNCNTLHDVCFDIAKIDLFNPGKQTNYDSIRVITTELGELKAYRYTVIFARHKGNWLYCRHKDRDVFETPGGGIERGETPLEGAKRELYEETGAVNFTIYPAFDYAVYTDTGFANGQAFYADIQELGELSQDFEMAEVCGFDTLPGKMRFPKITPVLYERMVKWLEER